MRTPDGPSSVGPSSSHWANASGSTSNLSWPPSNSASPTPSMKASTTKIRLIEHHGSDTTPPNTDLNDLPLHLRTAGHAPYKSLRSRIAFDYWPDRAARTVPERTSNGCAQEQRMLVGVTGDG